MEKHADASGREKPLWFARESWPDVAWLEMGLAGESRPTACDVGPELWTVGPAEVVALLGWPLGPGVVGSFLGPELGFTLGLD